jgi:hypothetical protein
LEAVKWLTLNNVSDYATAQYMADTGRWSCDSSASLPSSRMKETPNTEVSDAINLSQR